MNHNTLIKENNILQAIQYCLDEKYNDLAMLLLIVYKDKNEITKEVLELENKINQILVPDNSIISSKKIKVFLITVTSPLNNRLSGSGSFGYRLYQKQ